LDSIKIKDALLVEPRKVSRSTIPIPLKTPLKENLMEE